MSLIWISSDWLLLKTRPSNFQFAFQLIPSTSIPRNIKDTPHTFICPRETYWNIYLYLDSHFLVSNSTLGLFKLQRLEREYTIHKFQSSDDVFTRGTTMESGSTTQANEPRQPILSINRQTSLILATKGREILRFSVYVQPKVDLSPRKRNENAIKLATI